VKKMESRRKKLVAVGVIILLIALTVPIQYLVRKDVVVGLEAGAAHSHAHAEEGHIHIDTETGGEESAHEHTDEEGHLAAEVPLGINLIPNFGFEVGTPDRAWGWLPLANEEGAISYRDGEVSHRGLYSAAVDATERETTGAGWITRFDELPLGHDAVFEGYIKTELLRGEAYLAVVYEFEGEGGSQDGAFTFTQGVGEMSDWTYVNARVYIPPEALGLYLEVLVYGQGRAWFDDLSLVIEEPAAPETGG
jgi:hypothetical protein